MLISNTLIATRYGQGREYLTHHTYKRFAKELYGSFQPYSPDGAELLLLLYALDSWDNRQGAQNAFSERQLLAILDRIFRLKCHGPSLGSGSVITSGGSAGSSSSVSLFILDSTSVDLSLSNNKLSATVKLSSSAGNQLALHADGLYVAPSNSSQHILLPVKGSEFSDAVTYINQQMAGMQVQVFHRGLGFLIYNEDDPADNEFELLPEGGLRILIPGFDAREGNNYFHIILNSP